MKVLVTGARGFLGGRLLARLGERGIGATRTPSASNHVAWSAGEPLSLAGVDVVIHAAAHRPRSYGDASEAGRCLEVNAVATAKLAEDAVRGGVRRFVYVSAGNVYRPMGRPAREDDPIWPSRRAPYYLASKICGEVFAAAVSDRVAVTSVRPSAIYGPGMPPGMIPTFLAALREGRPARVADGGRHRADLVHVDDVIDVLLALADAPVGGAEGLDAINVGSGRATTSLEVAEQLCDLLDAPRSLVEVEAPAPGAPPGFEPLDISRAARVFGYAPRALQEGLRSMVRG